MPMLVKWPKWHRCWMGQTTVLWSNLYLKYSSWVLWWKKVIRHRATRHAHRIVVCTITISCGYVDPFPGCWMNDIAWNPALQVVGIGKPVLPPHLIQSPPPGSAGINDVAVGRWKVLSWSCPCLYYPPLALRGLHEAIGAEIGRRSMVPYTLEKIESCWSCGLLQENFCLRAIQSATVWVSLPFAFFLSDQ